MHSSENARRSQRRRPDLNINTAGTRSLTRYSTAPQFSPDLRPPVPAKGSLKPASSSSKTSKTPAAQTMRNAAEVETFLDMLTTPVDMSANNKENDRPVSIEPRQPNVRDSHDLSLPQRHVRDSLMSNMLLSLDQFSVGQLSNLGPESQAPSYDNPTYSFGGADESNRAAMGPTIRRRPNHGYTYSSDYEAADNESRISSQHSRGRRSNSSSGFQSSLGRINSMRESLHRASQPGTPSMLHSRGGKGSKSSSTNSIDQGYAQVLSSQRWAQGFGATRSSSFDYGQRPATTSQQAQQPWHIEFSNTFFNEDLDAAPTPTVPGGPRRLTPAPSMPSFPRPPPPEEPRSPVDRKRSTRSSRSATVGRQAQTKINQSEVPALPAFDLESAPAPNVGYEKAKEPVPQIAAPPPPPKERSGFFRKIFGSFRDTPAESPVQPPQPSPYVSSGSTETVGSRGGQHALNQAKTQSTPPSRESHHSSHGPTLQKKSSSFFRRRKKSVNDAAPPPPLPASVTSAAVMPTLQIPNKPEQRSGKPEASPATSLSRAMDPFLKHNSTAPVLASREVDDLEDGPTPRDEVVEPARRNVRGFSPDYEPPPSAIIRSVHHSASDRDIAASSRQSKSKTDTPTRQPPQPPHPARTGSFLSDTSDSETSPKRIAQRAIEGHLADPSPRGSSRDIRSTGTSPVLQPKSSRNSMTKGDGETPRVVETVIVDSTDDEEARLTLPIQSASSPRNTLSPSDGPRIRSSMSLPNVKVDNSNSGPSSAEATPKPIKSLDEPEVFVIGEPTEDDRQKAQRMYDGNEDFIQKEKAAAWMGEEGPVRQRTLQAYMELYDFQNLSIAHALRDVCCRLILRAETQQVDRILVCFSKRWCDCNPNHGFRSIDVVHTLCYSIMLLNTDLHIADIEQKMTRSQFVKNTITTIRQALAESVPDAFERPSILPGKNQNLSVEGSDVRPSGDQERTSTFRNSFISPLRSESSMGHRDDPDGCGPLVKAPFEGTLRAWEGQVEIVLKETYNSIRDVRLPLFGAEQTPHIPTSSSLSVIGMLKRTPSVLSKAPSEGGTSTRGRINDAARTNTSRWTSKSRSRPRLGNNGFSSSRTSFDDGNSLWSPTPSSATWSRYSLGRTQGSGSMDSFGSAWPRGDFQQSIGFANALSQAIIREDVLGSAQSLASDDLKSAQLLEDESLELAGPPWVKEGIVMHKHHLDGIDKKAKDRNWSEVFAVVQKGNISLFSFASNKSTRSKGRSRQNTMAKGAGAGGGAVIVGGGNWQENATNLGTFNLKQTLASALPPPGYSRSRPHVWALSLPTGAVHLFHVGTAEICKEFVTTANYWSARLSTHPLVGGISNIEYGWGDDIVNNALVNAIVTNDPSAVAAAEASRPASAAAGRVSMQSRTSIRSGSFDFGHVRGKSSADTTSRGGGGGAGPTSKLPGDRVRIADWQPPTQSLRPSNAPEAEQLQTLLAYVRGVEAELQAHNALRSPMLLAFTPRGGNAQKAMANWERKSSYLLREIVKFRTYVDCLQEAERRSREIYREREVARRAARGEEAAGSEAEAEVEDEDEVGREFGVRGKGEDDEEGEETVRPGRGSRA